MLVEITPAARAASEELYRPLVEAADRADARATPRRSSRCCGTTTARAARSPRRTPSGSAACWRTRHERRGGLLVALGPLVLAVGLGEHAGEQVDERDAHHERLLERHQQPGHVQVVERAQPPALAGRAVAVVDQLRREGQQDPEQRRRAAWSSPCRAPGPSRPGAGACGSATAGATSRGGRRRRRSGARARGRPGCAGRRRRRWGRARATSRRRRRRRRRRGGRTARRRARCGGSRRVTGRRIHFVRPSVRKIGARSATSRCWTMCAEASCSPSTSIGEIRARNRHSSPAPQDAARQPLAARGPPSARAWRQRSP